MTKYVEELVIELLANKDLQVLHDDAEHGLTEAELKVRKVIMEPHIQADGTFTDAGYKSSYSEEQLMRLGEEVAEFSTEALVSQHAEIKINDQRIIDYHLAEGDNEAAAMWQNMSGTLESYITLVTNSNLHKIEVLKRCAAIPYTVIISGK